MMKKLLATLFITVSLIGFTLPLVSYAQSLFTTGNPYSIDPYSMDPTLNPAVNAAQQQQLAAAGNQAAPASACDWGSGASWSECFQEVIFSMLQFVGNFILSLVSWVLWVAGIWLNLAIITMVVHMKDFIDKIGAIFVVWRVLRDFVNMFFIFILLVIAIQTILQTGNYRKMLINLVLVALFLNFSFFFTGVMIDASNTMALLFYKGFSNEQCTSTATLGVVNAADGCMSYNIVQSLKLQTIYVAPTNSGASTTNNIMANIQDTTDTLQTNTFSGIVKFLTTVIAGSILMIIVAGVFFASAVLIFFRFVELIMLLMLSPLAFASIVLPSTSRKIWSKWWDKLLAQLIFAPAYFMFLWISMKIITSGTLIATLSVNNASFVDAFKGNMSEMFGLIANYVIIIMLLGYSLYLAKELGAQGVGAATKVANGFQGFVGRNTVGRAASRIANSQTMQSVVATLPFAGRLAQKPFDSLAKQSFGGRKGGFEQAEKDYIKDRETQAKRMGPSILMQENVKSAKSVAHDNRDDDLKNVNTRYEPREKALADEEKDNKKAIEDNRTKLLTLEKIVNDPTRSESEKLNAKKTKEETESEIASLQELVKQTENKQAELKKQKDADMAVVTKAHEEKIKLVDEEADRVLGVDADEAKRRAKAQLVSEGKNPNDKEAVQKIADKIMKDKKGIAKIRQEEYAKSNQRDYGAAAIASVGKNMSGPTGSIVRAVTGTIGGTTNVVTSHTSRVAGSAAVRKLAKGKSKEASLYETITKAVEETESEGSRGGGAGDKDKTGGDGGGDSGDKAPKTT